MQIEDNFWDKAKLDRDRVGKLFTTISDIRKSSTCPFKTIDSLVSSLNDFNLREMSYVLLFLDYISDLYAKKILIIADTLNCDNNTVLETILSYMDMFEGFFKSYNKEEDDGM